MRVGIIGAGRIGGNCARRFAGAGHEVMLTFSRDPARLRARADEIGGRAGTPAETVAFAQVVVLSVPWDLVTAAVEQTGDLAGTIVVDTTNQYGSGPMPPPGQTAAQFNVTRITGARYTKSFNTLTAGFQAETAERAQADRVVQWICGDDADAKRVVAGVIDDAGYLPVDLGGTAECAVMEPPRRPDGVYGEEYRLPDALAVVDAVRARRAIPPTPQYSR